MNSTSGFFHGRLYRLVIAPVLCGLVTFGIIFPLMRDRDLIEPLGGAVGAAVALWWWGRRKLKRDRGSG
jgi:hypothetical protein